MSSLTMASLFSGSGSFEFASMMCGFTPIWSSEIEPFPLRVTEARLPFVKHYGNVSEIHGDKVEKVDLITFGSPCQDLSVAGKRKGLKHSELDDDETTRSGLFMEAVRIAKEMRDERNYGTDEHLRYPRWMVWENVPGAFSSQNGADFRCVLEELARVKEPTVSIPMPESGKWATAGTIHGETWSIAWRTVDAQYFGVPQRRRRIYLVADFDDDGRGCASEILFKRKGLSRNFKTCKEAWEAPSGSAEGCADVWRKDKE